MNTCASQAPCLVYTENSCIDGKRSVCISSNPNAANCALAANLGQNIDTMCGYNNGRSLVPATLVLKFGYVLFNLMIQ